MKKKKAQTKKEKKVMDSLTKAWRLFCKLPQTHPMHKGEFCTAIHHAQDILIHKIVQRDYPEIFPVHKPKVRETKKRSK